MSILFGMRSVGEFFSEVKRIRILAPFALVYLLSIAVLARIGEFYSYEAFWHFIGLRLSFFLIVVMGGLFIGHKIEKSLLNGNRKVSGRAEMLTIGILLFGSLMSFVIIDRNSHLSVRLEAWRSGPAPISVLRDIEEEGHWARTCWLTLRDRVGLNDRL